MSDEAMSNNTQTEEEHMTYEQAKQRIFATGIIPDGYFGDTAKIEFAFHNDTGKTLAIHEHGYFTYHIPCATDRDEAFWLLAYHPSSRATQLQRV